MPALHSLEASLRLRPWLDGGELIGAWSATVTYTCGVTLDPFDKELEGAFSVTMVPPSSLHAPSPDAELSLDPDADDPPDVLEGDTFDAAGYVIEHLAIELDPLPAQAGRGVSRQPEEPTRAFALRKAHPAAAAGLRLTRCIGTERSLGPRSDLRRPLRSGIARPA